MTMQVQEATRTHGTINGRTRYLAFGGAGRLGRTLVGRGRTCGSRHGQEVRTVFGCAPDAFLRDQRQPEGE